MEKIEFESKRTKKRKYRLCITEEIRWGIIDTNKTERKKERPSIDFFSYTLRMHLT